MKKNVGFIGCGNMGGALARATAAAIGGEQVYLCDAYKEKAKELAQQIGASVCELNELAQQCDYIFLGVKPQMIEAMFEEFRPSLDKRNGTCTLISMTAGVSIAAVQKMAGDNVPIIRIMPNTPVAVGEGMILYNYNAIATDEQVGDFKTILSKAGRVDKLDESKIDAASAISGCGPAYVYMFAEALADGAVACGLPRDNANLYAAQTLMGAAKLLMESGKHPGALKDAVCSPGGTTIAGVRALENGGFRAAAMNAVIAAYDKTMELKK